MSVELRGDLLKFLILLLREGPGKVNHHRSVAIFQDILQNPGQNPAHEIMESQGQTRDHDHHATGYIYKQLLHFQIYIIYQSRSTPPQHPLQLCTKNKYTYFPDDFRYFCFEINLLSLSGYNHSRNLSMYLC